MLNLLTTSLPRLVIRARTHQIKSVDVCKAFIEMWFERETWRQLIHGEGIPPTENSVDNYFETAQQLSQEMFEHGVSTIPIPQKFVASSERILLDGLPLEHNTGNISFIHKTVQDYFTSRSWISALTSHKRAQTLLGARLATSETGLLQFVTQLYDYTLHHISLMELVLASHGSQRIKQRDYICTAAANAVTILNSTRFSFSGKDLSEIDIQGAILDNAMMHNTNLSRANLTEVSFRQAWLEDANMSDATLTGAWFGQQANIILPTKCACLVSTGSGFIAVTVHGNLCNGRKLTKIRTTTDCVMSATVVDGIIYVGTIEGALIAWDLQEQEPVFRQVSTCSGRVLCIAVSKNFIFSGGSDYTICVWKRATGEFQRRLVGHTQKVSALVVHNGKIFSGSTDNTVRIWDLATYIEEKQILHSCGVQCLAVCEGMIISGCENGTICVWDAMTLKQIGELPGHTASVSSVIHFEGKIISGSWDATVLVWDVATRKVIDVVTVYSPVVSLLVWNGKVLVGCDNNNVQVWDFAAKPRLQRDEATGGHSDKVNCVTVVDGKIVIVGDSKTVQIVDALSHYNTALLLEHSRDVQCMVLNRNSVISWGGEFLLWDVMTERCKCDCQLHTLMLNS